MQVLDASSIIYAWDNYPEWQFPPLWAWIASEIDAGNLVIPVVAFEEVDAKQPDCGKWLKEQEIKKLPTTAGTLATAVKIKGMVGIVGDKYHPKGVGENDIIIIATTKLAGATLITDEEKQKNPPIEPTKRKIPAVCDLPGVSVTCISFVEYMKASKKVFQ